MPVLFYDLHGTAKIQCRTSAEPVQIQSRSTDIPGTFMFFVI